MSVSRASARLAGFASIWACAMACSPVGPEVPETDVLPRSLGSGAVLVSSAVSSEARVETPPTVTGSAAATASAPAVAPAKRSSIADDVPAAMARARAEKKRAVVVDVWAPWCHTCLSMKHFVLPDPALNPVFERTVFATVDSDRDANSSFLENYAVNVWPTFFVIDVQTKKLLGMWEGAASVEQLRELVTSAVDAVDAKAGSPLAAMVAGQRALARADYLRAARHYRDAVRRGGAAWSRRSEALSGWIRAEQRQRHFGRCAQIGVKHADEVRGAAVPTDFAWVVLSCAGEVRDKGLASRATAAARACLERQVAQPSADASVDDRSDTLSLYASVLREAGEEKKAREARLQQLAVLEAAAARAPSPAMASTFDYARLGAYLALGRGEQAVAMLRRRTVQLKDSYEPRARLAQALLSLGRFEAALKAIDGAVKLAYGPRRLRYLDTRAKLLRRLARPQDERAALRALLEAYDGLSAKLRARRSNRRLADSARRRLAELGS